MTKPLFTDLAAQQMHYLDALTYITIRSFNNYRTGECYPAYGTIAERMGMSKSFVIDSVKRLADNHYLKKQKRYSYSNRYQFISCPVTEKIPFEIFALDLTPNEKAMLILLRQCCVGTRVNIHYNLSKIASVLGVTYKTVYTQIKSLIEKGYVNEIRKPGKIKRCYYKLTELVDWSYKEDAETSLPEVENIKVIFIL